MSAYLVTETATIMSGRVVRWYRSDYAADHREDTISASVEHVCANGYIDKELFDAAWAVHLRLKADSRCDLTDVVTHKRQGLFGPLLQVSS